MTETIQRFSQQLGAAFSCFFEGLSERAEPFESVWLRGLMPHEREPDLDEQAVLLLAIMPHIAPRTLDILFLRNKDLDRPHTEFGGANGLSHGGFLPTGETAVFLLSGGSKNAEDVANARRKAMHILDRGHWLNTENVLSCEGQGEGEPLLSGRLVVSDETLTQVFGTDYRPEYNASFPALKITTPLDWDDLVLPYDLREELDDIAIWLANEADMRHQWHLDRIVKRGYRVLFYGPPGTGKTLTAMLLGQQNEMDVYRVDLSMVVSKYIGETEKNLARVFDKALHHNWILFFDEADALFGRRTEANSSNDRHANQEVAYLLQRIEDHPGMVILATNLKDNLDEAFFRRFQSSLHFPMPDKRSRIELWRKMLPKEWLAKADDPEELLHTAAGHPLSGGSIVNAVQSCAISLHRSGTSTLTEKILKQAIAKELAKESQIKT